MTAALLAVDAPYLLYRSFFALPESIRGVDGRPVGALLGSVNAMLRVVAERRPRAVVMCTGEESADYRVSLYPAYHADRPPMPDPLAWQFSVAGELFSAFGWEVASRAGLEADDVLGELARLEAGAGGRALLLTGDRDMYQCVGPAVSVLFLRGGQEGFEEVDEAEVGRRYGVSPPQVPDFIALRGDPSDGLPGARGIGPKAAAELLARHGSLEGALEAVRRPGTERPRVVSALCESADELRAFREIATLQPVPGLSRPADRATDLAGGAAAARALGMRALAERLEKAGSLEAL